MIIGTYLRIPLVSQRHHGHRTTPKLHVGVHVGEVYITGLGEKPKVTGIVWKKHGGKNKKNTDESSLSHLP